MTTQFQTNKGDNAAVKPVPPVLPPLDDDDDLDLSSPRRTAPRWRRNLVALLVLTGIVGGGGYGVSAYLKAAKARAAGETQFKIAPVALGDVKKTVSASGTLQPWSTVDIKSKAGGRVERLLVDVGDPVKPGLLLARIDPADSLLTVRQSKADLDSANARETQGDYQYQLQIKQSAIAIQTARAQLASAQASAEAARTRYQTALAQSTAQPTLTSALVAQSAATLDAAVRAREQLTQTQAQDLAQTQASVEQAKADAENAGLTLGRQQSLLQKGFVSQSIVDQATATARSVRAALTSAQKRLSTIGAAQQAERAAADARVVQAQASLRNAQAQIDVQSRRNSAQELAASVKQADAQVAQSRAALNQAIANQANNNIKREDIVSARATKERANASLINAQNTLDQTSVRSPSEGVVLQKYVEQGTIITSGLSLSSTGTSILQLGDISKMYVDVTVDETDIANVDEGQTVDVTIDAYPGVPFEGKVSRVNPQAISEQNVTTVHVRVEVDNSSASFRLLKPGMNATCEFVLGEQKNVVAVPSEAVKEDDNGSYVEVATGGKPAPADPTAAAPADPNTKIGVTKKRVPVVVGLVGNETTEITSGLKGGENIIVQTIEPEVATTPAAGAGGSPFGGGGGGRPGGGGGGFGGGGGGRGR